MGEQLPDGNQVEISEDRYRGMEAVITQLATFMKSCADFTGSDDHLSAEDAISGGIVHPYLAAEFIQLAATVGWFMNRTGPPNFALEEQHKWADESGLTVHVNTILKNVANALERDDKSSNN